MIEKFKGALIGLACGDALGATTENMSTEEVARKYWRLTEIVGGGWLNLKEGQTTDDTDMTICVAKGILENPENPIDAIGRYFIEWLESYPVDVGAITYTAINLKRGVEIKNWDTAGMFTHSICEGQTAGNGSLMRTLPVALAYKDRKKMLDITRKQSRMTHYDKRAEDACVIYNNIARRILEGEELREAIREEILDTQYAEIMTKNPKYDPNGYVVHTFGWVLRALWTTDNYENCMIRLANLGRDADTTCAIAGGLAGLYYGYDAIPDRWKDKIILKDEILELAEKLYDLYQRQ
jgi:ADP-ribosyl-[dinitrogen reductase] hydrolase